MSGIKSEFPPFYGRDDPKAYLEWEKGMELVFDRKKYSELKKVREATFEFYGYANTWWHQLETCRRRNGKNPVKTWAEMKAVMRKHFVPCGYHQEQHYVDPFRKLEDLMLAYLQAGQQHLKKRNSKPKVEAKPPTEVADFVEQSGQEEVIAVQKNLQSALTMGEENHEKNEHPESTVQEPELKKSEEGDSEEQQTGGNSTEAVLNKPCTKMIEENPGVIHSMLIKEKMPDSPQIFPIKDGTVSRTKLFQEGGIDVIMESSKKDIRSLFEVYHLNHDDSTHETTWRIFSAHSRNTSKKNQVNRSRNKEVIQFTSQENSSLPDSDLCTFSEVVRPNQKDLSYKINFPGILIHSITTSNWNLIKSVSYLKDIDFTSQWICPTPNYESRPKIVFPSPTQEQYRHKTSWRILMDLSSVQQAQEKKEIPSDEKDTLHLLRWVNLVQNLKSSRPNWFASFQTYVWHPGGISTKPSKPSKLSNSTSRSKKQGEANNNNSNFKAEVIKTSSLSFMQI